MKYYQRYYESNREENGLMNAFERNKKFLPVPLLASAVRNEEVMHVQTFGALQGFSRGGKEAYKLWLQNNSDIIADSWRNPRVHNLLGKTKLKVLLDIGFRLPIKVDAENIRWIDTFSVREGGDNSYSKSKAVITPQFCAGIGFYNSKEGYSAGENRKAGSAGAWTINGGCMPGLVAKWNNLLNPEEANQVSQERSDVYINKSNTVTLHNMQDMFMGGGAREEGGVIHLRRVEMTDEDLKKVDKVLGYDEGTGHILKHSGQGYKNPEMDWRGHRCCFKYPTRDGFRGAIDSVYGKLQKHLDSMLMGDVNRKYRVEFRIVYGFPEAVLERFFFLLERDKWAFLEKFLAIYGIERNRVKATVRRDVSEERSDVVVE
jgi:hypothetical protein